MVPWHGFEGDPPLGCERSYSEGVQGAEFLLFDRMVMEPVVAD